MKSRYSLPFILFVLCFALAGPAGAGQRPNVVLVITDDQGYGDLSCHGNPVLKTPHLDKLHAESVRLTDYHVAPTCSPSRAALITGHWTNRTGVWHTIMGRSMLRANEVTIGKILGDGGYHTGMFGKWHLGDNYPYRPEDRGFQEVLRHGGGGVSAKRLTSGITPTLMAPISTMARRCRPRVFVPMCSSIMPSASSGR